MNEWEKRLQDLIQEAQKAGYMFTVTGIEKTQQVIGGVTRKEVNFTFAFNEGTHGKKNPPQESIDK